MAMYHWICCCTVSPCVACPSLSTTQYCTLWQTHIDGYCSWCPDVPTGYIPYRQDVVFNDCNFKWISNTISSGQWIIWIQYQPEYSRWMIAVDHDSTNPHGWQGYVDADAIQCVDGELTGTVAFGPPTGNYDCSCWDWYLTFGQTT
jgi:hypothetical protein